MSQALFDTSILFDALNRIPGAAQELRRYARHWISRITWTEIMAAAPPETREATLAFLGRFDVIELDASVAQLAAEYRQRNRIRLPDAIIWASAQRHALVLVTRNTKDFPATMLGVRIPYTL
jgi:predicted nucleic acid-binding protein